VLLLPLLFYLLQDVPWIEQNLPGRPWWATMAPASEEKRGNGALAYRMIKRNWNDKNVSVTLSNF
jgi:hypothetical protein